MDSVRFLVLTDLHVGWRDNAAQENALTSLVKAVLAHAGTERYDAVLLPGDLAYSGGQQEYEAFERVVLAPLLADSRFQNAVVMSAPGNHDLNCGVIDAIQWTTIGNQRQEVYFDETEKGTTVRTPRARGFAEYNAFAKARRLIAPDTAKEVSRNHLITADGERYHVIVTNTAFFSDKDPGVPEYEKLPAPLSSLRSRFNEVPEADFRIVVGHHPITWFRYEDREPLKSLLVDHNAVYFHGHEHDVQARFGHRGLLSIGLGAAYQNRLDPTKRDWYQNSFAICEIAGGSLHVAVTEWHPKNGVWARNLALPSEFRDRSDRLDGGYRLSLPSEQAKPTPAAPRTLPPQITGITAIGELSENDWRHLLLTARILEHRDILPQDLRRISEDQHITFVYNTAAGTHRVKCIQSRNEVTTKAQIEAWSNLIDYERLESLTVASFGSMTDDARTAYLRLRTRRPLRFIQGEEIAAALSLTLPAAQMSALQSVSTVKTQASLVVDATAIYVLVRDVSPNGWFTLLTDDGSAVAASASAVNSIRSTQDLEGGEYSDRDVAPLARASDEPAFERAEYLNKAYLEFNSVRYTALAAIGVRLPDVPLDALYVPGSAEAGEDAARRSSLERSIQSTLDTLGLKGALRYELESQLKIAYGLGDAGETSFARRFYQNYGAICVQGDPGSGKTCLVKSEILAYCRPPAVEGAWYAKHVPVYVQLSEAARRVDDQLDLLDVGADLAAHQGLPLNRGMLRRLFHSGQVAFFFDGLDEIVLVSQRARLVEQIAKLVASGHSSGNRFVLTTRPAAAQVVELPEQLKSIHLRGLARDDQKALISRVLAARVASSSETVALELRPLSPADESLADQILNDVNGNAGLSRLATNPLFLTLLVFIYANAGRPSAKRHKVYAEAVKTLATVRSRIANQRVIPDADLRSRLGALALFMYRDAETMIARMSDGLTVVGQAIASEGHPERTPDEVRRALQDIAESTGLLLLSDDADEPGAGTISFMHQSFLDYFAALGIASKDYLAEVRVLAPEPRWREVIQLLCGIVGDFTDVAPIIRTLLTPNDPADAITLRGLLFAYDCALECDVPAESVQRMLIEQTYRAFQAHALDNDPGLRDAVGERLARLSEATVGQAVVAFLAKGLVASAPRECAFFVDMLGHIANAVTLTDELLEPFRVACGRREREVVMAVCAAVARSKQLRTPEAIESIRTGLGGSLGARIAAARCARAVPMVAKTLWDDLKVGVRDKNMLIASLCADAILQAGLASNAVDAETERLLADVLCSVDGDITPERDSYVAAYLDRASLDERLSSPQLERRLVAIRALPWLKHEEAFVVDRLRAVLRNPSSRREEIVATLSVIQRSESTDRLLKIADVDRIRLLLASPTSDVRTAACRALGAVGAVSSLIEAIVDDLLAYAKRSAKGPEYAASIRALAQIAPRATRVSEFLAAEAIRLLDRPNTRDKRDVLAVVRACQSLDEVNSPPLVGQFRKSIKDRSIDSDLRRECVVALALVEPVSPRLASALCEWIEKPVAGLGNSAVRAVSGLVARCRKRVEDVHRAFRELESIETELVRSHRRYCEAVVLEMGEGSLGEVRRALEDIRDLLIAYKEFAERTSVESPSPTAH